MALPLIVIVHVTLQNVLECRARPLYRLFDFQTTLVNLFLLLIDLRFWQSVVQDPVKSTVDCGPKTLAWVRLYWSVIGQRAVVYHTFTHHSESLLALLLFGLTLTVPLPQGQL